MSAIFFHPLYVAAAAAMFLFELYLLIDGGFDPFEDEDTPAPVRAGMVLGAAQRALGSAIAWPLSLALHVWAYIDREA